MTNRSMFIVLSGWRPTYWSSDKEDALGEACNCFNQYVSDFLRHKLPLKLSEEEIRCVDLNLFEMTEGVGSSEVELPFQEWIDSYYDEQRENAKWEEDREYKRYLELHEKYGAKVAS